MDNDDEIIIIDSDDEEWAASFAPKPKLNSLKAGSAGGGIGAGPSKRAEPEKYEDDDDDDEIEIVEEKMVVRRTPTPGQPSVVAIQLTAEEQKKILFEASKNFMRDIRPTGKITACSIVVGNKKAAEAEAKLRMEQREKEKEAVLPGGSSKRKFGTELASSKKRKHDSKASISAGSNRNSSDQENTTPSQSELRNGNLSAGGSEAIEDCDSFNGSFVNYIRRFTEGERNRGPVAKKTASVTEPAWLGLSSMKTRYTEFLAEEVGVKHRNGMCYVSSGLFSKVYSNFTLEVDMLHKRLKEIGRSGGDNRGAAQVEHHFIYSGWIISYISLRAAIAIVDAMGKKPAVLHKCLRDLNSASKKKVVLIDDLSDATRKPKALPGTHLSDLSGEEFGYLFGLCTHEKAEKILKAKRENAEGQKPSRKMKLRAKLQEGSDHVARAQKKRAPKELPSPPKAELAKMCTGRVKPLFRTTRGSQGGGTAAAAAAQNAGKLKARDSTKVTKSSRALVEKDSAEVTNEVSRAQVENQTPESPGQTTLDQRAYDAPPFDPESGKIVNNPPDVVHLCRTPLLDKKGIRFPDGWFIRGKLKPDKTRYHFYYHSPDGKRFKNYQEAVNYCLENGHSMSDLNSSHRTAPKKRKNTSSSNQGASPTGTRTSVDRKTQSHRISDANNAIMPHGKVEPEAAESQKEREKTAHAGNNTAKERFKYIAVRKFPINVSQPTSHSSPSASTTATDEDCSPTVSGKSMISKKRKRSPNSHPDLIDGPTTAEAASVHFNLSTFRPLPFRSVDGWFSSKVSALRRIVHEAEKEAGASKKVNLSSGGGGRTTAATATPTAIPAACTASPGASESADAPPSSKPESERRGTNGRATLSVTYSEGLAAMTDLHEYRHARARAVQYTGAAERKVSSAAAARARKQELVAKKIAECSTTAAAAAKRRARAVEDDLCLPPGCYKRSASLSRPATAVADAGGEKLEGRGVLYCNAEGETFDSLSKLWAAETADEDSWPEYEYE